MANLGTLWFGADIDLTQLRNKINQGNQGILDALKMNYDPQSYQQMVSRLRSQLDRETFEIKISTNAQRVVQNVRNGLSGGTGKNWAAGLDEASLKIVQQTNLVKFLTERVADLRSQYQRIGGIDLKNRLSEAQAELKKEEASLKAMKSIRSEYNHAVKQSVQAKKQASQAARELTSDHVRLNATLAGGIHISSQLGSALNALYGVHAARQFLNNVIEIGGQLEKQRISMGAIVGDTARANVLFNQIKGLALKSPFGVVELDQYSKQLAAYGIEQSRLFDMTKRLADISAGAGQDFGRLALALGHVKSATYLTGITLRQFSMNNIPMLKMLAEYYSEIEKRAVTTAEVQKRISERKVSYEDVEEQIRRMTDEGGMFYNMQEKISESVAAKWKNLKDSLDIMYGEMAESSVGSALKGTAEILMMLTTRWQSLLAVIGVAVAQFGLTKVYAGAQNIAMAKLASTYGLLATSSRTLAANQVWALAVEKQITKEHLLNAVATGRLTVAQAQETAALWGVTEAQLVQIANSGKVNKGLISNAIATSRLTVSQLRALATIKATGFGFSFLNKMAYTSTGSLTRFGAALARTRLFATGVGVALKSLGKTLLGLAGNVGVFVAISAAFSLWQRHNEQIEKAEELSKSLFDTQLEGLKNVRDMLAQTNFIYKRDGESVSVDSFGTGVGGTLIMPSADGVSADEMQKNIEIWTEFIKNYAATPNMFLDAANAADANGKAVMDLAEKYEYLGEVAAIVSHSQWYIGRIGETFADSIKKYSSGVFDDSLMKQMKDYEDAYKKFTKTVYANVAAYKKEAVAGLNSAMQNQAFASALKEAKINAEAYGDQLVFLATHQEEYTDAVNRFRNGFMRAGGDWAQAQGGFFLTGELRGAREDLANELTLVFNDAKKQLAAQGINLADFLDPEKMKLPKIQAQLQAVTKVFGNIVESSGVTSEAVKGDLMSLAGPWGVKIDVQRKEADQKLNSLKQELERLTGQKWVISVNTVTNYAELIRKVREEHKKAVDFFGDTKNAIRLQFGIDIDVNAPKLLNLPKNATEEQKMLAEYYNQMVGIFNNSTAFSKATGVSMVDENKGGKVLRPDKKKSGGSKADEELKKRREWLDELKKYYAEYEKFRKSRSKEDAIASVDEIFGELSIAGRKVSGREIVDNYAELVRGIVDGLKLTTAERKKFATEVKSTHADILFKQEEEAMKDAVAKMKEYMDEMSRQWSLYHDLLKKTGDESFASLAFEKGVKWDDVANGMLQTLEDKLKGHGINIEDLKINWGEATESSLEDLFTVNGQKQKDLVDLALKIRKLILDNYSNDLKQQADAWNKGLTSQEKLNMLLKKRNDLEKELNALTDEREREGKRREIAANDQEIQKAAWENFKEQNDWGRVFGDLGNMSLGTIREMIRAMESFANANDMGVEQMKAWQEAMQKLTDRTLLLDAPQGIKDSLEAYAKAKAALDYANGGMSRSEAKRLGITDLKTKYTEAELRKLKDEEAKAVNNLIKSLKNFGDQVSKVGSSLQSLGSSIGGNVGTVIGGIGGMLGDLGNGISAIQNIDANASGLTAVMQKVSAVTAIIGSMIEMNKKLSEILPNAENRYEHYAEKLREVNKLREAVDDYRRAVADARAEESEWFAGNSMSNLLSEGMKAKESLQNYYKELYEAQAIYKNKGAGWKKAAIPVAAAVTAAVGALTLGAATPGLVAGWTAVFATMGTTAGTVAGIAFAAGIGAAAGQVINAGLDAITYGKGQTSARNNLRIQTRHKSFWRGQKTKNLEDWAREQLHEELFDSEGLVNLEVAEQILEKYGDKLVGDTKDTLERLVELRKEYDDFIKQIHEYVGNIGTSLADSMTNAIWDWLSDGEDAVSKFYDYASGAFKSLAQDIVKTFMKVAILDKYKEQLEGLFEGWSTGRISDDDLIKQMGIFSALIAQDYQNALPIAQKLAQVLDKAFGDQGYDIKNTDSSGSSASNTIKGVTETTADFMAYINAIRADMSVNRVTLQGILVAVQTQTEMPVIARAQLQQLEMIARSTATTAANTEAINEIFAILHANVLGANSFNMK